MFEARSWAAGRSEATGFGEDAIGLRRCRTRVMTGGAHLSARRGEGQRQLSAGALPCGGCGNGQGIGGAHGPAGPDEEGGSPRRSGPARQPGLAGLKSEEKIFSE
jgi:hypothetical protein